VLVLVIESGDQRRHGRGVATLAELHRGCKSLVGVALRELPKHPSQRHDAGLSLDTAKRESRAAPDLRVAVVERLLESRDRGLRRGPERAEGVRCVRAHAPLAAREALDQRLDRSRAELGEPLHHLRVLHSGGEQQSRAFDVRRGCPAELCQGSRAHRPGRRRFDVLIEGVPALEAYAPKVDMAESFAFDRAIEDGVLDLEFVHRQDNPKISAIEIRDTRK
jgi:hypothetical protein